MIAGALREIATACQTDHTQVAAATAGFFGGTLERNRLSPRAFASDCMGAADSLPKWQVCNTNKTDYKSMTTQTIKSIIEAGHDKSDIPMVLALCQHLDCDPSDLDRESYDHYGLALFSLGSKQYAIGDDEEADKAVTEYISQTLWAFRPSFLADQTGLPEEVFEAIQEKMCEDANEPILRMVEHQLNLLVEDAVSADGRGHFLSSYDGNEHEATVSGDQSEEWYQASNGAESLTFCIYRIN